ncbi:MAG: hypothetical protein ABWX92_13740, partial [Mycetocola sp.]
HVIALVVIVGPLVLIAIAFAVSRFMHLNPQTHAVLRAEIDRLEAGGSKDDVTPEARAVVEKLTGHPYESAWPGDAISPTATPVSTGS